MSELIHKCSKCDTGEVDCTTCKLATLNLQKKKSPSATVEEDDYSISERLTENKKDNTILILVAVAALTFALVVAFTKMLAG